MRRRLIRWGAGLILLPCSAVAIAMDAGEWAATTTPGADVVLLAGVGTARVFEGDQVSDYALPSGVELSRIARLRQDWIAVGTERREDGRELALVRPEANGELRRVPAPKGRAAGVLRQDPVPVVRDGRLRGLIWLEGSDPGRLRVMTARWNGERWRRREVIAPPGAGSQLALSATVLADGSWLAVWSSFDGEDDEIAWSRRVDGDWSRARRLGPDNQVPDITPTVIADGSEAVVAWSRYDGEGYRLTLSRFQDGAWTLPEAVGERGSVFPTWHREAGTLGLLYRSAAAGAWVLLEMDPGLQPLRRAAVVGSGETRPIPARILGQDALVFPSGHHEALSWDAVP